MLSIMDARTRDGEHIPFAIEFVTCNERLSEGGKIIKFENAVQVGGAHSKSEIRNPNNYRNYMRNIRHVDSDRQTKIDPWLVRKFNGMEVMI